MINVFIDTEFYKAMCVHVCLTKVLVDKNEQDLENTEVFKIKFFPEFMIARNLIISDEFTLSCIKIKQIQRYNFWIL